MGTSINERVTPPTVLETNVPVYVNITIQLDEDNDLKVEHILDEMSHRTFYFSKEWVFTEGKNVDLYDDRMFISGEAAESLNDLKQDLLADIRHNPDIGDIYLHKTGTYYVVNAYSHYASKQVRLFSTGNGGIWAYNSPFDGDDAEFQYVGNLTKGMSLSVHKNK